jgi:transposase InsO family protein
LCEIGKVSRSGYYRWLKNCGRPDEDENDYLIINELFEKGKRKLGWRSIQMRLKNEKQIIMNHKKIIRIMKKYQLFVKIRRRNPYKFIAKKTQEHRTFENKLNREFRQLIPFRVFCTDITYMFFGRQLAYLSVIKDICSGEIVAWEMSMHIDMRLVVGTVEKLKSNDSLPIESLSEILIHSDQGFHYTNPLYIKMVKDLDMVQSMSRKGNCIDNAPMESFFGHLKDEVNYENCQSFGELKQLIGEYIEYYNNRRYQWKLKKMTPVEYRNHLLNPS